MDKRLQDRVVVITGASSGLGKATALKFAGAGARIVCSDLRSIGLEEEICKNYGEERATFVACDVTKEDQIQNLIQEAVHFGGRLDCLLNYAGIALEVKYRDSDAEVKAHNFPTEDWDREMAVNCRGVYLCCKYALQTMLAQEPREPNARGERTRGWIVNAASMLGTVTSPRTPAYTPSKFAVVGMTKQMAIDYAKDRIHINAVCPGFVETPMIGHITADEQLAANVAARHPWNALGRPEDIADAALFLCSDESAWVTGHSLVVDGAYTAQ